MRRHAEALREWFARETGWMLQVEREGARLFKRPADLASATRGLPATTAAATCCCVSPARCWSAPIRRSRCACSARRLLQLAAEPALAARGFTFTLTRSTSGANWWRCAARCSSSACCSASPATRKPSCRPAASRPMRSTTSSAARWPACWPPCAGHRPGPPEEAPAQPRRAAACAGRRARRGQRGGPPHGAAPPVWRGGCSTTRWSISTTLEPESRAYFVNQRGAMAARLCEAAGLVAEQRAEGLALVDETGALTDVAMPAEGTDAHVTLLVAEYLAQRLPAAPGGRRDDAGLHAAPTRVQRRRRLPARGEGAATAATGANRRANPAPKRELAAIALERLEKLHLVARDGDAVRPLPALARFCARRGRGPRAAMKRGEASPTALQSLFELTT